MGGGRGVEGIIACGAGGVLDWGACGGLHGGAGWPVQGRTPVGVRGVPSGEWPGGGGSRARPSSVARTSGRAREVPLVFWFAAGGLALWGGEPWARSALWLVEPAAPAFLVCSPVPGWLLALGESPRGRGGVVNLFGSFVKGGGGSW